MKTDPRKKRIPYLPVDPFDENTVVPKEEECEDFDYDDPNHWDDINDYADVLKDLNEAAEENGWDEDYWD